LKREGHLEPAEALRILLPIIEALSVVHARGIIHRDLKPENVFLSRGPDGEEVPKLLDFGIAKLLENSVLQTQAGSTLGTPGYMSPEQMRGVSELTPASDVWGMGVILFRTIAGRLPYAVDPNPTMMVMFILMNEAPRLRELAPDAPKAVAAAVDLALKHSPETRHRDMNELLEALLEAAAADGIPVVAPRSSVPPAPT
ncbi:MAG: serine/threonine protein kinase, partial [Sandaracinaceae bacterium]|nr:serine/threonine protein kinase [Sandaracinaceae bacterium]